MLLGEQRGAVLFMPRNVGSTDQRGASGGAWDACTHLNTYRLNTEPRYAKALVAAARMVKAHSALEFGCGIGLYSSYLALQCPELQACGGN